MNATKMMHVTDYRDTAFVGKNRPCLNTIKNWIKAGKLSGEKIGGRYYVHVVEKIKTEKTGDKMADDILNSIGMLKLWVDNESAAITICLCT